MQENGASMAKLNISQAARATGKNRSTIQRHIKSGKLSMSQNASGETVIDTAELIRVFGELKQDATVKQHIAGVAESGTIPQLATSTIEALQKELEAARERERTALKREEWLKEQLYVERERSKELERRLLPPSEATRAVKKRRWPWQRVKKA